MENFEQYQAEKRAERDAAIDELMKIDDCIVGGMLKHYLTFIKTGDSGCFGTDEASTKAWCLINRIRSLDEWWL